jgi:hypothetical protein
MFEEKFFLNPLCLCHFDSETVNAYFLRLGKTALCRPTFQCSIVAAQVYVVFMCNAELFQTGFLGLAGGNSVSNIARRYGAT